MHFKKDFLPTEKKKSQQMELHLFANTWYWFSLRNQAGEGTRLVTLEGGVRWLRWRGGDLCTVTQWSGAEKKLISERWLWGRTSRGNTGWLRSDTNSTRGSSEKIQEQWLFRWASSKHSIFRGRNQIEKCIWKNPGFLCSGLERG